MTTGTSETGTSERARVIACCTFCTKPNTQVAKLISGPGVYVCNECVELCCDILQDTSPHPSVAPWEQEMTLDQVLMVLPSMALARAQFEENLVQWVRKARSLGATWSRIGEALDMTRQSAWERFSGEE